MKCTLLGLMALCLPLLAEIIQVDDFAEVVEHVDESTALFLDIDNTIIRPKQWLGSTPWGWAHIKKLQREGYSRERAEVETNALMKRLQLISEYVPVESKIPRIVGELQKKAQLVMGLTHRLPQWRYVTADNLLSCGIDLSIANVGEASFRMSKGEEVALFEGIIFVDKMADKGLALKLFLESQDELPERVVFADDNYRKLREVESAMGQLDIPFLGIHCRIGKWWKERYDGSLAEVQLRYLDTILSDSDAQKLIDAGVGA